ncbi:MAG: glycosyltransferase [Anaerolineales bacterium]
MGGRALWENRTSPNFLLRAMALLPKAVYATRLMQREGIRHIHAHYATHPAFVAWVIHRLTGIRYSITVHAHDIFVHTAMLATKLREAAFVVAISEYNREYLARVVGEWVRDKIHLVHCGITPDAYRPRPASSTPNKHFEIISFSPKRLNDDYSVPRLLWPYVDFLLYQSKRRGRANETQTGNGSAPARPPLAELRLLVKGVNGTAFLTGLFAAMYPDARFIALVRNGLALCEGFMRRGWAAEDFGALYEAVCQKMLHDAAVGIPGMGTLVYTSTQWWLQRELVLWMGGRLWAALVRRNHAHRAVD